MGPSSIWGRRRGGGGTFEARSPMDGSLLLEGEMFAAFEELARTDLPTGVDLDAGCAALAAALRRRQDDWVTTVHRETGFSWRDCAELVEGSLAYAEGYAAHPSTALVPRTEVIPHARRMRLVDVPIGTVAAILPHNAFLPLGLAVGLNALRAGNRVVLRAPQGSALSASLLAEALSETVLAPWLSVVVCSARPFVDWFFRAPLPGLLHFFGSSRHAADLVSRGFEAGKTVLIDGEGNAWAYVHETADPTEAARMLAEGAFRYNGGTCTSVNGAIVHPAHYETVAAALTEHARRAEVGPLFDEAQAEWCLSRILEAGGEVSVGGTRAGAFLQPTVVQSPDPNSALVREGLFGPALWIAPGDAEAFAGHWALNRYPLCAAIFQEPAAPEAWAARLPDLARLVINGDPSIEDPFEFWGGYAPAGANVVSLWPSKYRRVVQIDEP